MSFYSNISPSHGEDHHNGLFEGPSKGLTQRGVSVTNLKQCRAFYLASMPNAQALADHFVLEWSHYVVLLAIPMAQERRFLHVK